MMDLEGRVVALILGCFIGFVLGYLVRTVHDIKEKVDHVDDIVGDPDHSSKVDHDDRGSMKMASVGLLLVVLITAYAAFMSQHAVNEVKATQAQGVRTTRCDQEYLSALLNAVNERTTASQEASDANSALQKSWFRFVKFQLHVPPYPIAQQRAKANIYVKSLHAFVKAADKQKSKVDQFPYPTTDELGNCLNYKE